MAVFRVPGPVTVEFGSPTPITLGTSKAGAIIRTRTTWTPITDDEHGSEPANFIFTGKSAQVEFAALDVTALKACNVWGTYGGLLMGVQNCLLAIGALATALGKQLNIVEREASYVWTAPLAVPLDPDMVTLASTTELVLPTTFLIVPYNVAGANYGKLFTVLPSYLV